MSHIKPRGEGREIMQAVIDATLPLIVLVPVEMKQRLVALKWREQRSVADLVREAIAHLLAEREPTN